MQLNPADAFQGISCEVIPCRIFGGDINWEEVLLSYVTTGSDVLVLGSLIVLATLLQTKELDEPMLDALGILPQRKQHKKLLLALLLTEGNALGSSSSFDLSTTVENSISGSKRKKRSFKDEEYLSYVVYL
ncbi:hypothetical protein Dimus_009403 [Dionaea muscipula]